MAASSASSGTPADRHARRARDAFEREVLLAELKRHNHRMTETAKALGLERSHLYKKCQALGIDLQAVKKETPTSPLEMAPREPMSVEQLRSLTGQEAGSSDWIRVDQQVIDAFAEVTGDRQWIHIDPERAKSESRYGQTIAHGFLTLSLLSRLSREAVEVTGEFGMRVNYGLNRVRFPAPVPEGSRIRARFTVQSVEDVEGGYQIVWLVKVDVEGSEKPALVAEWLVRLYR